MRLLLFFIFINATIICRAQPPLFLNDFKVADSIGLNTKYKKDIIRLSRDITQSLPDTLQKVRAIYRWIIENIRYDVKAFNKKKLVAFPECKNDPKCEYELRQKELKYLKKRIKKRKAVCDGYARLFKLLCEYSNIKAEYVAGAVRTKPYQLDGFVPRDHAWNAVLINNTWYFLDLTWAAGSCVEDEDTGLLLYFVKEEKELHFLTPYEKHIKDHHPDKAGWLALLNHTTAEKFKQQPFYYSGSHTILHINSLSPATGIITTKIADTLTFVIDYNYANNIDSIQVNTNVRRNPKIFVYDKKKKRFEMDTIALKKQVYIPFQREGNKITFTYIVTDRSLFNLDILFKYKGKIESKEILRYRIKVPWVDPG
jgi:hypothetical protein